MLDLAIVIVSYNTRDLLRICLRSLYASEGDFTFHVTVIDNDSSDGSLDMVRAEYPQAHTVAAPHNGGFAYANNLGLQSYGFGQTLDVSRFTSLHSPSQSRYRAAAYRFGRYAGPHG